MIMFPCPLGLGLGDFVGVDATQVELTAGDLEQRAQRPDGIGAGLGFEPQHEHRPGAHPSILPRMRSRSPTRRR